MGVEIVAWHRDDDVIQPLYDMFDLAAPSDSDWVPTTTTWTKARRSRGGLAWFGRGGPSSRLIAFSAQHGGSRSDIRVHGTRSRRVVLWGKGMTVSRDRVPNTPRVFPTLSPERNGTRSLLGA
jgi:hypothetical protein